LRTDDINDRIVVIARDRPQLILKDAESRLLEGCRQIDRPTVRVYDCRRGAAVESLDKKEQLE
jgi:hypothetical protein